MAIGWLVAALLSPVCYSISSILDKVLSVKKFTIRNYVQLLGSISFWQLQTLGSFGVFVGSLPFFTKIGKWQNGSSLVLVSQFFISLAGLFFVVAASKTAVSIVAAIIAVQPAMTFFLAILISSWKPELVEEELTKRNLFVKGIGIALIAISVFILSL